MKIAKVTIAILVLAGCAPRPDAIPPVSMGNAFSNTSCQQAADMLQVEKANLKSLSQAQDSAATGDAFGVFLIGIPMSSVGGGDKQGEIGASKGKVIALENRLTGCKQI